ncbi:MAG: hypothetical protein LJE66_11235, partial [Desulfobacterales bacterium]|nr:hypothetical protein [Desulfobacterales bacterium]
ECLKTTRSHLQRGGPDQRMRPLKNAPFCPISASGSNFNPRNTQCIPEVKIFAFLELKQK